MGNQRVFLDVAIGDIATYADEKARHSKAEAWVKKWAATYGLQSDVLDDLDDTDKDTVRDMVASDPTAQQERWLVDAPKPLGGGRLVFDLWNEKCPKTCDNFATLCQGTKIGKASKKPLHYKSTHLFRLVPNFIIQGGDVTRDDGSGGDSIFNGKFNDEKAGLVKFGAAGQLAMANSGKNSNTSQFFVTLADRESNPKAFGKIDTKYVVFGQLVEGHNILKQLNRIDTKNETPQEQITVTDCGLC